MCDRRNRCQENLLSHSYNLLSKLDFMTHYRTLLDVAQEVNTQAGESVCARKVRAVTKPTRQLAEIT